MIEIYGSAGSSAGRCYWTLEEIGLDYKAADFNMRQGDHKKPEFLQLNPNGKIPVLVDGDVVLWESLAINSYLADKYKPELLGATAEERGLVTQWGLWSQLDYQKPMIALFIQKMFVPAERRDDELIQKSTADLAPLCTLLNNHLKDRSFMVGETFTLADISVASVAKLSSLVEVSLEPYPNLQAWLEKLLQRPALLRVTALERG